MFNSQTKKESSSIKSNKRIMKKLKLYGGKDGGSEEFLATVSVDEKNKLVISAENNVVKRDLMGAIFGQAFPLKVSRGPTTPEEKELVEKLAKLLEKGRKLKKEERKEIIEECKIIDKKLRNLRKNEKEELIVVPQWPKDTDFLTALCYFSSFWVGKKFGDYKITHREIIEE